MKVKNLKAYLANTNMTANQFSEIIECAPGYLKEIISGRRLPGKRLAKEIYRATDGVIDLPTRFTKEKKKESNTDQGENKSPIHT